MRTDFPADNLDEYGYYVIFNLGNEYSEKSNLFHYTNLKNRRLIVKKDHIDLRLTRADCFEDKNEIKHIVAVMKDACEECLNGRIIDKTFYRALMNAVLKADPIIQKYRKFYVFCASSNENSEYMKLNYAHRGGNKGIIIGLRSVEIGDMLRPKPRNKTKPITGIDLYDVIYDKREIKKGFSKIIRNLYQMRNQDTKEYDTCQRIIVGLIAIYSLAYKDPAFSQEEEIRLIVNLSELSHEVDSYQDDPEHLHIKLSKAALYDEVILCPTSDVCSLKGDCDLCGSCCFGGEDYTCCPGGGHLKLPTGNGVEK